MKPFTRVAVVVLWLIALLQLLRCIAGWEVTLNGALSRLSRPSPLVWQSWCGGSGRGGPLPS
jgi:hypothetical protein